MLTENANDIRLRWLDETFRRLLFQTRYRVNCFAYLELGLPYRCFAWNREGRSVVPAKLPSAGV
jgi:hypothetical protein